MAITAKVRRMLKRLRITAEDLAALAAPASQIVRNETGGTLTAETLVYVSGWDADEGVPLVAKADANAANAQAMFILPAAILNNANGLAYRNHLSPATLNTNAVGSAGDPVYLSETAGGWTVTAPTAAGSNVQIVGHVVVKSATVGQIAFNVGDNPTVGTADMQDASVTLAKLEPGSATAGITGTAAKFGADANVIGAIPVLHRIDITAGALGNTDVTLTHKTRVVDCWLVLRGTGVASTTFQVKSTAAVISSLMAGSGADQALVRTTSIDDAAHEIAAGGILRVTSATGATQPAATVYVLGVRVA